MQERLVGAEIDRHGLDLDASILSSALRVHQVDIKHLVEIGGAYRRPGDMVGVKYLIQTFDLLQIPPAPADGKGGRESAGLRGQGTLVHGPLTLKFQRFLGVLAQEHPVNRDWLVLVQAVGQGGPDVLHILRADWGQKAVARIVKVRLRDADMDGELAFPRLDLGQNPLLQLFLLIAQILKEIDHQGVGDLPIQRSLRS